MLPKENRLKRKKDIERVFKRGRGFKEGFLFLKIAKNNLRVSRFGFIVGKNLSKKATVRNRVRRKISELVRMNLKDIRQGIDAIFIAFPGAEKEEFSGVGKTIDKLFERAGVFKAKK